MKRSEEFYEGDREVVLSTAGRGETMQDILTRRWSRRDVVKGGLATGMVLTLGAPMLKAGAQDEVAPGPNSIGFESIGLDEGDALVVAAGHVVVPFLRWGDPIMAGAPEWDFGNQTAAAQEQQFGYNCDWIGFMPLPVGSGASDHGLLVVNHEYTNPELMFAGYITPNPEFAAVAAVTPDASPVDATPVAAGATPVATGDPVEVPEFLVSTSHEIVDVELAAHGLSVVEIQRDASGQWKVVLDSEYNRRITGMTPMEVTGPAAGIDLLKTSEDETGMTVLGTLNNCAGGYTPWGTALTGEENFQQYFANLAQLPEDDPIRLPMSAMGSPKARRTASGKSSTRASTCRRSPTNQTAMAGASNSIPMTRSRCQRSEPRSVATSTKDTPRLSHPGGKSRSTPVMMNGSNTPTSSLPLEPSIPTTGPPTWTCLTRAPCTSPASMTTAPENGCHSFMARDLSPKRTASPQRRMS